MPANFHKIPEIQKLLNELEKEAKKFHECELPFAQGMEYCIKKIREIIDSA